MKQKDLANLSEAFLFSICILPLAINDSEVFEILFYKPFES